MIPRFVFDDRRPSAVTEAYMRVIREAVRTAGFLAEERATGRRPSRRDYIVTSEVLVTFRYMLSGYRRHVVWLQGIVPEESYLRRRSRLRRAVLSFVERAVLKCADLLLLVSPEMLVHYEVKYGLSLASKSFIMPCFSETRLYEDAFSAKEAGTFAYVGSLSAWQCFEQTAWLYAEIERYASSAVKLFVFTEQEQEAERILKQSGARNYEISCRKGEALLEALSKIRYGFVLRDEASVNRVATPTKLSVYAACGMIPIYSPSLADFSRHAAPDSYGVQVRVPPGPDDVSAVLRSMEEGQDMVRLRRVCSRIFSEYYHVGRYRKKLRESLLQTVGIPLRKRRVLFVVGNMRTGGIPNALYTLLGELREYYDISLLAADGGAARDRLPEGISVLDTNDFLRSTEMALSELRALSFSARLFRVAGAVFAKLLGKTLPFRLAAVFQRSRLGEYDIAVSFEQPTAPRSFCGIACELALFGCRASRRIAFVHCDFVRYGGNTAANRRLLRRFDRICAVSEGTAAQFLSVMPETAEKLSVVRSIVRADRLFELARGPAPDFRDFDRPVILSVCRLAPEKGLLRCIPMMQRLREEGFGFSWHIVGDGPCRTALLKAAAENGLSDAVFLHGERKNPYPYMARADFLFLPSYHEAAPLVIEEAQYLGLPVLVTDTSSARELTEGFGMVCGIDDDAVFDALRRFLSEKTYEKLHDRRDRQSRLRLNAERTAASVRAFRAACGEESGDEALF